MNFNNINTKSCDLGNVRSVIRETFEYGNRRAAEIGRENVFDYSLGNPSISTPNDVTEALTELLQDGDPVALHGYTSAPGAMATRSAIAEDINRRFGAGVKAEDIYMTCGAAASLTVALNALVVEGDEVIGLAPFFPEYRVFAEKAGAKFVVVDADREHFQINFEALSSAVNPKTKAVIVNSPNNPTGVVYSEETVAKLCAFLKEKSKEYGAPIYLLADEPYRELVYDENIRVPYLVNCYEYTLVCYSYSKSLSLPGERIGYVVVSNKMPHSKDVFAAVAGAGRALGFVCAPSLFQHVIPKCLSAKADLSAYRRNRDLLYGALTEYGFDCVHPDGAFYLFVRSPEADAGAFCMAARDYELLLVPSDSFGCKGYVRISYCVTEEQIRRSLPAFKKLAERYNLK